MTTSGVLGITTVIITSTFATAVFMVDCMSVLRQQKNQSKWIQILIISVVSTEQTNAPECSIAGLTAVTSLTIITQLRRNKSKKKSISSSFKILFSRILSL